MTSASLSGNLNRSFIDIRRALEGAIFPASKQALIEMARHNHAPARVTAALEALPDQKYRSPADISRGIGHEK